MRKQNNFSIYLQSSSGKRYPYRIMKCHARDPQACQDLQCMYFAPAPALPRSRHEVSRLWISRVWIFHDFCHKTSMPQTSVGSVPLTSVTSFNKICTETSWIFEFHLFLSVQRQTFCIKNYQKLASLFTIMYSLMQQGLYQESLYADRQPRK